MKTFLLFFALTFCLVACSKQYEYKQIIVEAGGTDGTTAENYSPKVVPVSAAKLNSLGDEGWELVSAYPIIETLFPNFGDSQYVTGIRTNTRTKEVLYIFKREK